MFFPILFGGKIHLLVENFQLIFLFFSFCFASSLIYIINDILDLESDKAHPQKRKRPIASGFFKLKEAKFILISLAALTILSFFMVGKESYYIALYLAINILYSFKLKKVAIVDVVCIGAGFVLRIYAGAQMGEVNLSQWMIIMVFLLSVSIAFAKRRSDYLLCSKENTLNKGYSVQFLDVASIITFTITLIAYILYTVSPEVMQRMGSEKLYYTSIFVFIGIMRYLQLITVKHNRDSPIRILYTDKIIQIALVLWLATFTFIIYL